MTSDPTPDDDGSGFGRVRLSSEPGATKVALRDVVTKHVEPDGPHLIADGYRSYRPLTSTAFGFS